MAATCCWKVLNALSILVVNILSFHYKSHHQNKTDETQSWNKLECEADLRYALSSTKPRTTVNY